MARFGRRFEVKREIKDIEEIRPDDSQKTGGKSTTQSQEETKREASNIGFDDSFSVEDTEESLEEYRTANAQVESELEQYYDDDITQEELKSYLVNKISDIYGNKLQQCNILVDSLIEGFLDMNEFNGAKSYNQLIQIIEESIMTISQMQESRRKSTRMKEISEETGLQELSEEEAQNIVSGYRSMSEQGELSANAYLSSQAKKLGISKKDLTSFILEKGKSKIASPDKVLHYHRTSIQNFQKIMQTGYLLNRRNMQLNGFDISDLSGSSSSNIQFSRDIYDEDGELQSSGFDIANNLGANSADVVFVMNPELMSEETYNCFSMYPTVEKADIQKCCATILARNQNIQMQIESILKGKNMPIRTMLQEQFDRDTILEELTRSDLHRKTEEKSVNGRDILSSAITATEETTRTGTINRQVQAIKKMQRVQNPCKSIEEGG